ncbi:hypothetical protein [Planomicrobium okeanokoites]|uniref:Cold-inducible protein YdjO n=1 Tax=Planomicrobium okeanokoites TaxID=244 RepID=A0ABV7KT24_PLAOK|nr:hypothetical protein [Planomicrobium okeanokoites]
MIVKWECSDCGKWNQTNMAHWLSAKDGQGFQDNCKSCHGEVEVDIEVSVTTI